MDNNNTTHQETKINIENKYPKHNMMWKNVCIMSYLVFQLIKSLIIYYFIKFKMLFQRNKQKIIKGDVALITGGANGLGKEIAIQLADNGCNIAIVDIDIKSAIATSLFIERNYRVKSKAYHVDVSVYDQVVLLEEHIARDFGNVDILVNNAGIVNLRPFSESSSEEIDRLLNVNLKSFVWTIKVFLDGMKKRNKGHIVAISSVIGLLKVAYATHYCAAKHGIRGLMDSLDSELLCENSDIATTIVYPYFMTTNKTLTPLIQNSGVCSLIPILDPVLVAQKTVEGILVNKKSVVVPSIFNSIATLSAIMPDKVNEMMEPKILDMSKYRETLKL